MKYGLWTVIDETRDDKARILVKCICGLSKPVRIYHLRDGRSRGCRSCSAKGINQTHGVSGTRLYRIWKHMITRCYDKDSGNYRNYGARGITVCAEWRSSIIVFYNWSLANGYAPKLQLERQNNNLGYSPNNCCWVTPKKNNRNRRNNHLLTAFGETKTLVEWSEDSRCIVSQNTLHYRIKAGMTAKQAITKPSTRRYK
jgi:hypothetical protein